ncbi:MAG: helix-turn-helix domain-containing protein [Candidatus Marinimicrobia bacterium]|nr:helix-turn-helix domain-containing protein [Candidatus Neomarinimicrobiota bacterium]
MKRILWCCALRRRVRCRLKPTGRAIADLRRRKGLSRAEFAAQIGVSPATVTKWEQTKGTVKPHAKGRVGLQRLSHE